MIEAADSSDHSGYEAHYEHRALARFARHGHVAAHHARELAAVNALTSGCFQRLDLSGPRHARDSGLPRPSSIASTVRYTAFAPDRFKGFWRD
jgi:hypothetical protein